MAGLSKTVLGMVPRVHMKKGQDKRGIVINVYEGHVQMALPAVDCGPVGGLHGAKANAN